MNKVRSDVSGQTRIRIVRKIFQYHTPSESNISLSDPLYYERMEHLGITNRFCSSFATESDPYTNNASRSLREYEL